MISAFLASFISGIIISNPFDHGISGLGELLELSLIASLFGPFFAAPALTLFLFIGLMLQKYNKNKYVFWVVPMTFIGFFYALFLYLATSMWDDYLTLLVFTGTAFATATLYWWLVSKFKIAPTA